MWKNVCYDVVISVNPMKYNDSKLLLDPEQTVCCNIKKFPINELWNIVYKLLNHDRNQMFKSLNMSQKYMKLYM